MTKYICDDTCTTEFMCGLCHNIESGRYDKYNIITITRTTSNNSLLDIYEELPELIVPADIIHIAGDRYVLCIHANTMYISRSRMLAVLDFISKLISHNIYFVDEINLVIYNDKVRIMPTCNDSVVMDPPPMVIGNIIAANVQMLIAMLHDNYDHFKYSADNIQTPSAYTSLISNISHNIDKYIHIG